MRAVWVYPLKIKGEVAVAILKEWMPRAQRESGHKVKVIRTDNGGEFIGADFESVLKKKGIQHQLTVPYNPQLNGVAERFNQPLQEGARTLLGRAELPDPFWVTALRQDTLMKNRVLATMGDKQWVPYTKWYGSAPAVNMLRAYGCMVVFHVPKEKRGMLEASGRWRVHLGLAKDHKGWLIWDLTSQQLTVSRDVKFLESLYYKEWKQQQQKLPTTPLIIEADEVQRPSRQVQVTVSEEEINGVTKDGGEPEVEEQQQQQQDAPQGAARPADRPRRDVRPPNRLTYPSFGKPKVVQAGSMAEQCDEDEIAHCYWAAVPEPKTLAEALCGPDAEKWKQSVKEECDSLLENETWELCELPPGKKAISSKLIFRHKYGPDGELTRYKSRLVAKGFQQTKGKDFDEIFAPVGKGTTLRAPRAWYHKLEETLLAGGLKKSECDHSLFLLQEKEQFLMLLVYVDDILLFSKSSAMIEQVEEMLEMQLKCSKMGDVKYYLGMHVERDLDKGVLRLHQRKYCEGLAEKYGLQDGGKPATLLPSGFTVEPCADEEVVGESDRKLFHSMVGALNYAANHTRPDIAFATSRLAGVVSRPNHEQLEAAKRMELLFNHYGLLEVMDGELKRPASEGATKEWDRRSKDGFFLLSQCLSSNQLHHIKHLIKDIQCGPKAWKILKDVHAPSSEVMVVVLERQLHAVKINEGDAVQGAFDQLRDLYVKLSAAGVYYPEKIKCYKALSLLPESWGPLVVNLNGMKDSWSLEWIRAQVQQEEFQRKELTAAAGEGGGSAYGMKGLKGRGSKKGKAMEGSGGEQYSGGKRSNKGGKRCGGKCWYCHVEGHPWFKCRKLPDGWRPGQPSIEGSKGVHGAMGEGMGSEEGDGGAGGHGGMFYHVGEACFEDMVVLASKVALHRSSHWVIDTGAFMTMTNREDLLDEVRPSKAATVVSATGQVVPVRGEGRAMFMGADGRLVGLKRVLLVPGLCANLLSTKALTDLDGVLNRGDSKSSGSA
ncbi:unnamed protein product [Closterium sp. NIES-53]